MRHLIAGLATLAAVSVIDARPSAAQEYPWCAQHSSMGGGASCGFTSFAQCQATISGIGGWCLRNPRVGYGDARERPDRRY